MESASPFVTLNVKHYLLLFSASYFLCVIARTDGDVWNYAWSETEGYRGHRAWRKVWQRVTPIEYARGNFGSVDREYDEGEGRSVDGTGWSNWKIRARKRKENLRGLFRRHWRIVKSPLVVPWSRVPFLFCFYFFRSEAFVRLVVFYEENERIALSKSWMLNCLIKGRKTLK